jgi:DNA invertase Pin-like site-specific DNA recombinase
VDFLSVQEPMLETLGPARDLIIAILAYFAAFERERHRERVKAGIERAKRNGVQFGRKPVPMDDDALRRMKAEHWSLREMARALRVGRSSVHRRVKELGL